MAYPVLCQFTASHYNEKARWALDHKRIPHLRRSLLPGFHARPIRRLTGQTGVPVLILDGNAVFDSTRIIAALEETQPLPPLYPHNEADRRRALALEEFFDEELGPHIRRVAFSLLLPYPDYLAAAFSVAHGPLKRRAFRLLFPALRRRAGRKTTISAAAVELGRTKTRRGFDRIEQELQPSGYLVGDGFSVSDLTAAALLSLLVAPPQFPYRLPPPPPELLAWRASLADHPAFHWVEDMYRRHRGTSAEVSRQGTQRDVTTTPKHVGVHQEDTAADQRGAAPGVTDTAGLDHNFQRSAVDVRTEDPWRTT